MSLFLRNERVFFLCVHLESGRIWVISTKYAIIVRVNWKLPRRTLIHASFNSLISLVNFSWCGWQSPSALGDHFPFTPSLLSMQFRWHRPHSVGNNEGTDILNFDKQICVVDPSLLHDDNRGLHYSDTVLEGLYLQVTGWAGLVFCSRWSVANLSSLMHRWQVIFQQLCSACKDYPKWWWR